MSRSDEFVQAAMADPRFAITDEDRRIASGDLGGAKVRKPRTLAQHKEHLADHHGVEYDTFDDMVDRPTTAMLKNRHEELHHGSLWPAGHTHR